MLMPISFEASTLIRKVINTIRNTEENINNKTLSYTLHFLL